MTLAGKTRCTAPSLNPNNPHKREPTKREKRAFLFNRDGGKCTASRARGAPRAGGMFTSRETDSKVPDMRVLACCSAEACPRLNQRTAVRDSKERTAGTALEC